MHFKALKSSLIESSKAPKRHISDALVQRIIEELKSNPAISQKEIAERVGSTALIMDLCLIQVTSRNYLGFWQIKANMINEI